MAGPRLLDGVWCTSTTSGTGTYTLGAARSGFRDFAAAITASQAADGDTVFYAARDIANGGYEWGIGTLGSSGTTLARTTIVYGSNTTSAVSWGTGTREVICCLSAAFLPSPPTANGPIVGNTSGNGLTSIAAIAKDQVLTGQGAAAPIGQAVQPQENNLINSGFWFFQRQAPASYTTPSFNFSNGSTSVDAYGPDAFKAAWQTATLQCKRVDTNGAQETGLNDRNYASWEQITNAGKFMIYQFLEGEKTYGLSGQTVTRQVKLKASTTKTIWIGLVALGSGGTMDTIAATIISAWGANSTDPTLATNYTYVTSGMAVPSGANGTTGTNGVTCSVTTAWQQFAITVTLPASAKNVAVVIWTDSQFSANDVLSVAEEDLHFGSALRQRVRQDIYEERRKVQAWFSKSYDMDTAPGTATESGEFRRTALTTQLLTAGDCRFPVTMRATPGGQKVYSTSTGTAGKVRDNTSSTDITADFGTVSTNTAWIFSNAAAFTLNHDMIWQIAVDASL